MLMKGIFALIRKLSSERGCIKFSYQNLESKILRNIHLWTWSRPAAKTEDLQMHHRTTKSPPRAMRSNKSLQGVEHANFTKELLQDERTLMMSTKTNCFKKYTDTKTQRQRPTFAMHSKEKTVLSRQWRFVTYVGLSSVESQREEYHSTVTHTSGYSDRQLHRGLRHASKGLHQGAWRWLTDAFGERFSVSGIIGKTAMSLVFSFSWPTEETPRLSKGEKVIKCNIENFVTMDADTTQKAVPSIEFSTAKGNLERKQEVEDTMLDLFQRCTQGLQERDASSQIPTLCFPTKRKPQCVHSLSERLQLWGLWGDTNNTSQVQNNTEKRVDLIGFFLQNSETWSRQITQFWTWKSSRDADTQRSNRARWFHEWDSEWSDEDEKRHRKRCRFYKDFFFRHRCF